MERLDNLIKARKQLARDEFVRKYPHLWLIRQLEDDEQSAMFRTIASGVKPRVPSPGGISVGMGPLPKSPARATMPPGNITTKGVMSQALSVTPDEFALYPIAKSGANPWSGRILLGRASNNDIVLRNDTVSKLHAYFQADAGGAWRVHDAKSANGTRVDGTIIPPGDEGVVIRSGVTIKFGSLPCEVIGSAELYETL
jgi:hypothetical protein